MGKLDFGIGKFTAALAEIATVACFLVYIGTYYRSFAATRITFAVEVGAGRPPPPSPPSPSRNSLHTGRAGVLLCGLAQVNTDRSDPVWSDPLARQGGWSPLRGAAEMEPRFAERFAERFAMIRREEPSLCLCGGERRGRTPSPRPPPL